MNETNHPARRLRHGERPTEPLTFPPELHPGHAKPKMNALIDAAEERAKLYDGDDRECIKADVMNAFFAGAAYTQAAANKAAEEGGLPEMPRNYGRFNINGPDKHRIRGWTGEQMKEYARTAIAAERASRQVANKAEVDLDAGFLQWVHDRMRFVHGENEDYDYMHKLLAIIASVPPGRHTPNVASLATPPAATGASTVLTDERIYDISAVSEIGIGDDEHEMSKRTAFARPSSVRSRHKPVR